jgi:hypothetical protein
MHFSGHCETDYHGFESGDLPAQGFFTINVGFVFVN